ncbi:MAG TPA: GNAT family N-acetyltransferase [Ktedonobacteraceae bacterium]|nr:GNAT family N-acetyltransferase [Ktedonobacteraceae bacterium]
MVEGIRQGLLVKHFLIAREMAELAELAALCNANEHLLMRLDYNMLALSTLPTDDLFLFYRDDRLVGCLLLDRYHSDVKEVTCMVHPAERRQGIFRQLLAAARKECQSRGIRRLLFICEKTSTSGQAFMRTSGAWREFAEHRMVLKHFQPRYQFDDHLLFREALFDDLDELALILAADFDDSKEQARQHVQRAWARPNQRFYIATYGGEDVGCAEPVGTLRVEEDPLEMGIYGFFVRPEYRGRGHGRQILEETILTIQAQSAKPVMLEVDTNNFTAQNLYHSCGFVIERTYEYYGLALE